MIYFIITIFFFHTFKKFCVYVYIINYLITNKFANISLLNTYNYFVIINIKN